uniref:Pannexin n=1 Tax=Castor canadensis TaxID=51338 RepID=A0A8C0WG96_CASCN
MLPKSQIPDLDPNTLDILGSTFSLLNTSNPTLAKDCWLCMTTGAVMPMAIPVNSTINNQDTCQSGLPFKVQPMDAPTVCLQGRMQNNSYDIDVGVSSFGNCSSVLNYSSPTQFFVPQRYSFFVWRKLSLPQFFSYIPVLFAVLLHLPTLFWHFTAAPHLCSDLKFIMEELDKVYNRAIKAAKLLLLIFDGLGEGPSYFSVPFSLWEISESHFKYPIVEQYLKTKKNSSNLIMKYISCRLVTFTIVLLACVYLGYYFSLSSLSDEFVCSIKSGILRNDSTIPDQFQCRLIAVGIFQLLSFINFMVYVLLAPVVVYALFVPFRQKTDVLKVYEILPTFDVLHFKSEGYNNLSLYNLSWKNISELKSYKCLKVLENIKSSGQGIDPMLLLTHLGMIKMDVIGGRTPMSADTKERSRGARWQSLDMHVKNNGEKNARQRLLNSSC